MAQERRTADRTRLVWALAIAALGTLTFLLPETRSAGPGYQAVRAYGDALFPVLLAIAGFIAAARLADIAWTALLVVALSFLGWLVAERAFGLALHPGAAGFDITAALGAVWDCVLPFAVGAGAGVVLRVVLAWLSSSSDDA